MIAEVSGPKGLAHLTVLRSMLQNYAEASVALMKRYGDVVRVKLPNPGVAFYRPAHVMQILKHNVLNYPKSKDYDMLKPILGDGIFVSEGDLWTRQRKVLAPEFRENTVGRFLPAMVESAETLFKEWDERHAQGPLNVSEDMMRLTLWIVGRTMFKSEFVKETETIGHTLEIVLAQATRHMLSGGLYRPWMPTPGNLEAKKAERELNDVIMSIIRRGREGNLGTIDVLSRMMQAKDPDGGAGMSDKQLLDEIKSLVLAGHETTSLALSWGFYTLAQHPAVFERLAEEASRVLGDRTPEAADVAKLEYARRVFLETMRLYPPVPSTSRGITKDDTIGGVRVSPGEMVFISPFVTHRHPEYWPDPERFDPERFTAEKIDALEPGSYMPFLLGRRACLGEHFAMIEGVLLFAMIARRYKLSLVESKPIETRPIATLRMSRPLIMKVERR